VASAVLAGPNTGGKTASLKALGLAVLMAKAGMFLPVLPGSAGAVASTAALLARTHSSTLPSRTRKQEGCNCHLVLNTSMLLELPVICLQCSQKHYPMRSAAAVVVRPRAGRRGRRAEPAAEPVNV